MQPCVITVALVGGELTRLDTPHLPLTPEEIGLEGARVTQAGASVVHLHARDAQGVPCHDPGVFKKIVEAIQAHCQKLKVSPPITQFSTGGSIGMSLQERMAPLQLNPEMATLTTGSVNFGNDIFENSSGMIKAIAAHLTQNKIAIEIEIFDAGMMDNALNLFKDGLLKAPLHFNFVLGVPGALGGEVENLLFLSKKVPMGSTWSVAGIGRHQLPLTTMALVMGGHVRVGLEDNIFYRKGQLSQGNVPQVERVVRLAQELGRSIATVEQARGLYLKQE